MEWIVFGLYVLGALAHWMALNLLDEERISLVTITKWEIFVVSVAWPLSLSVRVLCKVYREGP